MKKVNLKALSEFLPAEEQKKVVVKSYARLLVNTNELVSAALARAIKLINDSADGQKHHALVRASFLLGGYVAAGIIAEEVAISALENAIQNKPNVANLEDAFRTIKKCLKAGMNKPVTNK